MNCSVLPLGVISLFCLVGFHAGCSSERDNGGGPTQLMHHAELYEYDLLDASQNAVPSSSHTCFGDTDRLVTPCSNGTDGDWSTAVRWSTERLGDFSVVLIDSFDLAGTTELVSLELKASHTNHGSLMPTPLVVHYWGDSSWVELYALDDQEHRNQTFTVSRSFPQDILLRDQLRTKVTMRYSSHVAGSVGKMLGP